jgi:Legume lectin domain
VELNIYSAEPPHIPGTNFATDGSVGSYNPTGDVTLGDGDNIQVVLSYDGSVLTETLTDLTDGATYSASYTGIDLSEIVGANCAYIGFSAATGAGTSTQTVTDFNFESGQAVHWVGESGQDWTAADVWTDGNDNTVPTPNVASNVFVDEGGPGYTLTITSADTANLLTITSEGAGADIQDETGGSLTLNGSLTIDAGSFSLIGGALSAASIYVGANGHFIGYGNVAAPLDNDGGFVEAQQNLSLLAPVTGDGCFQIDNDAVLEFGGSVAGGTVTFGSENGTVKIDQPASFNGEIAGRLCSGDIIDLGGLGSQVGDLFDTSMVFSAGVTTLTVIDETQGTSASVALLGNRTSSGWNVTADGNGGANVSDPPAASPSANPSVASTATANSANGTVTFADNDADALTANVTPEGSHYVGTFTLDPVTQSNGAASLGFHFDLGDDQINLAPGQTLTQSYGINITDAQNPAMNVTQTVAVTVGGPENDNFVFKPSIGADTIMGFNQTSDTIELDHFANAQNLQQLESLITSDAHGDAVIALGNHDSITVAGVNAAQLHQLAQSGHVILH